MPLWSLYSTGDSKIASKQNKLLSYKMLEGAAQGKINLFSMTCSENPHR